MPEPRVSLHGLLRAPIVVARAHPVAATLLAAGVILVAPGLDGLASVAGVLLACALSYNCGAHASPGQGGFAVAALIVAMQVNMGFSEFPNVEITFPTLRPSVGYQAASGLAGQPAGGSGRASSRTSRPCSPSSQCGASVPA